LAEVSDKPLQCGKAHHSSSNGYQKKKKNCTLWESVSEKVPVDTEEPVPELNMHYDATQRFGVKDCH